ncbi:MAG: adenylosuccinate lyase [Acidobacteriota bacterium]
MISRYTLAKMGALWSEEDKFRKWLEVELAVCEVHAEMGIIPPEALAIIKQKADFNVQRIHEIEQTTRHDVIAFLSSVSEKIGPEARYVHFGLTSSDVVDTANALLLREALDLIIERAVQLGKTLRQRAYEFKDTPMIGRTHGVHAEPTSFGLVLALYYAENSRNLARLRRARSCINVGKISGAVGTFAHLDPEVEERVCARLNLQPAAISTQIIQRDRYAEVLSTLAITTATLEKIALEVRHLHRTEVREAQEAFGSGQKGSSAMPHKRNPIVSEQICGLARVVRSHALAAFENIALWHERDISHSSVERVILPDSCILTDYLLERTNRLIEGLVVFPERMLENIAALHGVIFSGPLLLELTRHIPREIAYQLVQRNAMRVWDEQSDFRELVLADREICALLTHDEIEAVFDLKKQLRNVDKIFTRVFGNQE